MGFIGFMGFGVLAIAAPAFAQPAQIAPIVDHIHLRVPDQAAAVAWYQKNFGGQPTTEAPDRLMLGDTRLIFLRNNGLAQPSTGSAIDHIGFSVDNLDATLARLRKDGVKVTAEPKVIFDGKLKYAFIEGPDKIRIEVVESK